MMLVRAAMTLPKRRTTIQSAGSTCQCGHGVRAWTAGACGSGLLSCCAEVCIRPRMMVVRDASLTRLIAYSLCATVKHVGIVLCADQRVAQC